MLKSVTEEVREELDFIIEDIGFTKERLSIHIIARRALVGFGEDSKLRRKAMDYFDSTIRDAERDIYVQKIRYNALLETFSEAGRYKNHKELLRYDE